MNRLKIRRHEAMGETWFNVVDADWADDGRSYGSFNDVRMAEIFLAAVQEHPGSLDAQARAYKKGYDAGTYNGRKDILDRVPKSDDDWSELRRMFIQPDAAKFARDGANWIKSKLEGVK